DALAGPQDVQAARSIRCLDARVVQIAQRIGDEHAHRGLVVDDEHDCIRSARRLRRGRAVRFDLFLAVMPRQVDAHHRAFAELRIDAYVPVRLTREAVDHGQAEPRSLTGRLGREERLEHTLERRLVDADAGVADTYAYVLPRLETALARRPLIEPLVLRLDRDPADVGHRIARVDAQVQQRVL